jgi:predicted Zn-dependent protease
MKAKFHRFYVVCSLVLCLILFGKPHSVHAGVSVIRDAEIEQTLREFTTPIFRAAGLTPEAINLIILQDDSINAFVAGGSNIFIHTGLIMNSETPGMLLGVLAHETGHIAGGHLARGAEALQNAQIGTILSYLLGAAAAVAGSTDAGMAIMQGGQHTAMRVFLSHTRSNEQSADQAALNYLDSMQVSASGLLSIFEKLRSQELRQFGEPDPYALTHPLTRERIAHIRNHVSQSSIPKDRVPEKFNLLHARMLAKLRGFTQPQQLTLRMYPESDQRLEARYARAVAFYRQSDMLKALAEIDSLLKEYPDDPYFHELKGQFLYEHGKIPEAIASYRKASELLPESALIRTGLAQSLLAEGKNPAHLPQAIRELEISTTRDATDPSAWRLLGIAYGRAGEKGRSNLALGEEALLRNEPEQAEAFGREALKQLPAGDPGSLRAEDIIALAKRQKEEKRKLGPRRGRLTLSAGEALPLPHAAGKHSHRNGYRHGDINRPLPVYRSINRLY